MKKIFAILLITLFVGLSFWIGQKESYITEKTAEKNIICYSDSDSMFLNYGYYKEEIWSYDYPYCKTYVYSETIDSVHGAEVFINEYKDTVRKIYIDYSNYPKREED